MQGKRSGRRSALRSGVLTGLSTAAVSGTGRRRRARSSRESSATVPKTDGFFAAYAVYLALVLVASALRVVVLPRLARAHDEGVLGRETASWALALAIPLMPGNRGRRRGAARRRRAPDEQGERPRERGASCCPWLIPAAAAQVFAGVAASALAALDDYGTAALGYGAGAVLGLVVIAALVGHGVAAFGWGLAAERLRLGGRLRRRARLAGRRRAPRPAPLAPAALARRGCGAPVRAPGALPDRPALRERARLRQADDVLLRLPDRLGPRGA